jgi:hypothetical protein
MTTKNILTIAGVVGVGVIGYVVYTKIKNKATVTSQVKAVTKGTVTTLGINVPQIAQQLGLELGTAYPVWDPRSWTENDTTAKELVLKVPKPLIPSLITAYYTLYKRNLQQDLQKLLDDYAQVSYLFT